VGSSSSLSSARSSSPSTNSLSSDRRHSAESAPPIVVVDAAPELAHRSHFAPSSERQDHQGNATPPRASTLNRLRPGPKDLIPMVGKPPRKQRSSRFIVTEKIEIERLPPFMGTLFHAHVWSRSLLTTRQQRLPQRNGLNFFSRSFISAVSCSTSTMPVLS